MSSDTVESSGSAPGYRSIEQIISTCNWLQSELSKCLEPFDITLSQFNVLQVLNDASPERVTCTDVGRRLLDRTPDVTRLLDRLEKQEIVERKRAEHDRRIVEVGITEKGRAMVERIIPTVERTVATLTSPLTNVEHRLLFEYLDRLLMPSVVQE